MVKDPEIYCRKLGHAVTLAYCVRESIDLPCRLVFQCWEGRLPIREHLLTLYSEAQLAALEEPKEPVSKLASIVDIVNQARRARR
ncbi:MAG TPA: hypothetical protein P5038_16200 [Candidatus Paceibacterota bacterium]|nr:hypothetical protein [Candidatus Paceibacterota bacterium]